MENLKRIIKSLSKKEKGDFKRKYANSTHPQGFVKLFDMINRSGNKFSEATIRKQFSSPSFYAQVKGRLLEAIYDFLAEKNDTSGQKIQRYLHVTTLLIQQEKYAMAADCLDKTAKIISKSKEFRFAASWKRRFLALSGEAQAQIASEKTQTLIQWTQQADALEELEGNIRALSKLNLDDETQKNILLNTSQLANRLAAEVNSAELRSKVLLLQRRIAFGQDKFQEAIEYSGEYLDSVKSLPVPEFQQEHLILKESKNLCGLLLHSLEHERFIAQLNRLSAINFKTPGVKDQALFYVTLNQLVWATDYGLEELFPTLRDRTQTLIQSNTGRFNEKEKVLLQYNFAKYCFVIGENDLAFSQFQMLLREGNQTSAHQLFYPYILQMTILLAQEKGELILQESLETKLKRAYRKTSSFSAFFNCFFNFMKMHPIRKEDQLRLRLIGEKLEQLRQKADFHRPFGYSPFPDQVLALIEKRPLREIRRERINIPESSLRVLLGKLG